MKTAGKMDRRVVALMITALGVVVIGMAIVFLPPLEMAKPERTGIPRADDKLKTHAIEARREEIDRRFNQAVAMLHARRYDYAVTALHRVLELAPKMPEAHVNMGFALYGQGKTKAALDFFASAIELRPNQMNAYYGLALCMKDLGDLEGAAGAMRSYIHRLKPGDKYWDKAWAELGEIESELNERRKKEKPEQEPAPDDSSVLKSGKDGVGKSQ